jgi:hypothetical protein
MKKRIGFVSNSSSTSFIICLPYIPHSSKDIEEMLYSKVCPDAGTKEHVASVIFERIKDDKPLSKRALTKELVESSFFSYDLNYNLSEEEWRKEIERSEKYIKREASKYIDDFCSKHKEEFLYVINFSDECGEGDYEHGNTFEGIEHIAISHY